MMALEIQHRDLVSLLQSTLNSIVEAMQKELGIKEATLNVLWKFYRQFESIHNNSINRTKISELENLYFNIIDFSEKWEVIFIEDSCNYCSKPAKIQCNKNVCWNCYFLIYGVYLDDWVILFDFSKN